MRDRRQRSRGSVKVERSMGLESQDILDAHIGDSSGIFPSSERMGTCENFSLNKNLMYKRSRSNGMWSGFVSPTIL